MKNVLRKRLREREEFIVGMNSSVRLSIYFAVGLFCLMINITLSNESDTGRDGWELVWSDEFESDSLDVKKWEYEVDAWGGGNQELQFYTRRAKNCRVEDGKLVIQAHEEKFTGMDEREKKEKTRSYTSARIRTKGKGDWKYGRFEIRARLPAGRGLLPAVWMLPTDEVYGSWASSGEIDIVEMPGHESKIAHGTLHYGDKWPHNQHAGGQYVLEKGSFTNEFHVFALEWLEGEIRWYVDGKLYQTKKQWNTKGKSFPAPFDQRFHLLINLAVGGNWPGPPDQQTQFPATMLVDFVRVYRKLK